MKLYSLNTRSIVECWLQHNPPEITPSSLATLLPPVPPRRSREPAATCTFAFAILSHPTPYGFESSVGPTNKQTRCAVHNTCFFVYPLNPELAPPAILACAALRSASLQQKNYGLQKGTRSHLLLCSRQQLGLQTAADGMYARDQTKHVHTCVRVHIAICHKSLKRAPRSCPSNATSTYFG